MSLLIRRATLGDVDFLYECALELRGGVRYSQAEFARYLAEHQLFAHAEFQIWVAMHEGMPVGMMCCNRFAMPRYLGFGVEIEEVVVHPRAQRLGHAGAMIESWFALAATDATLRKVIVKTDDQLRAGRVYAKSFTVARTTVFVRPVNHL